MHRVKSLMAESYSAQLRIAKRGTALAVKAVETQGTGTALATMAVETDGKGTALATKAVETHGKGSVLPVVCHPT